MSKTREVRMKKNKGLEELGKEFRTKNNNGNMLKIKKPKIKCNKKWLRTRHHVKFRLLG